MSTSTSPLLYAAESWEKVYSAFEQINFAAYDYDAVKQSLIDYLKVNYSEQFNDYTESSQMIALIELFAYVAEILAYRVDMSVHENLIGEATRKQSILRLAKLISYTATRNLPLRGLVKINSISVSEDIKDSQGNSLANRQIKWNDSNNSLWKEQFFAAINRTLTQKFGDPFKSFQIDDSVFQQYEFANVLETESERSSFRNGVIPFKVSVNGQNLDFELTPSDIDQDGVFERSPNNNSYFNILYGDDGYGDASDTTGFMMYAKQGVITKITKVFDSQIPNRAININLNNVNDIDVWIQQVDDNGVITANWENIPNIAGQNLAFNGTENPKKYEIETLENDSIRIIFGDGDFAEIPTGIFNIWVRQSNSGTVQVAKTDIVNQSLKFLYVSKTGKQESCSITYSLVSALQNSSSSEDIEHIRSTAPSVYYTQNRMVNGQDYNSFMLQDPSILRLRAVNRTFAGQPKYITLNDASGEYQNVKIFGNDLRVYYEVKAATEISKVSSRSLIDEIIEPALSDSGIYNLITYVFSKASSPLNLPLVTPRTKFIEDSTQFVNGIPLLEKTRIQGLLDRHYYGEPDKIILLDSDLSENSNLAKSNWALVNGDTDNRIYDAKLKMVTKNSVTGEYTVVSTPNNVSGIQESVIRQKRFGIRFNPNRNFVSKLRINPKINTSVFDIDSLSSIDITQSRAKEEVWTIEIIDLSGTFTVYGSESGYQSSGKVGVVYNNGIIGFLIGFINPTDTITIGDSFIINVTLVNNLFSPSIYKKNLTGIFEIVDESILPTSAETQLYDINDPTRNWIMLVERFDNESGDTDYWKITKRDFNLVAESKSTKFWFNKNLNIFDSDTKNPIKDQLRILKSNLKADRRTAIGKDQIYNVVSDIRFNSGEVNSRALSITPSDLYKPVIISDSIITNRSNSVDYLKFIDNNDYVYFKNDVATGNLIPVPKTNYIESLSYVNNVAGLYIRKPGREDLDFLWQHFTPSDHLVDPSVSNIIDIYVLTRGYYSKVQNYLRKLEVSEPVPPTSLELRSSYRNLLDSKMISDTVVLHSGKIKLLFGSQAIPELRTKFRAVRSASAKLTGDQIRSRILTIINSYFVIENWDFGQSFYATELTAVIHKILGAEIASVVLVPEYPGNYFGDLFYLKSAPDEVFVSCASLDNIEIVDNIDRITLKQK